MVGFSLKRGCNFDGDEGRPTELFLKEACFEREALLFLIGVNGLDEMLIFLISTAVNSLVPTS